MREIAHAEFSVYVEINAAGNGYRGHDIVVPVRSSIITDVTTSKMFSGLEPECQSLKGRES